jgi:hypothetical protein
MAHSKIVLTDDGFIVPATWQPVKDNFSHFSRLI